MNKKGQMLIGLIAFIVVGIILVLFFAGWSYGVNLVNENFLTITGEGDSAMINATNLSKASQATFGYYNAGMHSLELIILLVLIGYMIATFIIAYYSSEHPIFYIFYIIISAIMIILSVYIQNFYDDLLASETIGTVVQGYTMVNLIFSNLSYWMIAITFVGVMLMVVGATKRGEYQ